MDMEIGSQHFGHQHPVEFKDVLSDETKEAICLRCGEMVFGSSFSCMECEFYLHKKCAEAPSKIDHPFHRNHPLVLLPEPSYKGCLCHFCGKTCEKSVYHCSCKLDFHVKCALFPLNMAEKKLEELKHVTIKVPLLFTEDDNKELEKLDCFMCWEPLLESMYFSLDCGFNLHKKCVELPHEIKLCDDQVEIEYGSYSCFNCKFVVHVKCALEKKGWYKEVEPKDIDRKLAIVPKMSTNPIDCVIEKHDDGEMTKIKHFSHKHNLILSKNLIEEHCDGASLMDKYCDGCVLPISNPFYYCSECDFLLHKSCAKSPKQEQLWFHICQRFLILLVGCIFRCDLCQSESNGFSYMCKKCDVHYCLYCATRNYRIKHQAHKHRLFFDRNHKGRCSACNVSVRGLFKCKSCDAFNLHVDCLRLPLTAWHKCDEHRLALTYEEVNKYSEYQFCDICEKKRDSRKWFYHCATCDISAHSYCALGRYPFIKPGSIYNELKDHPHPLTFVRKIFSGPRCHKCFQPCRDLVLECADSSCDYVVHWDCVKPVYLRSEKTARPKTETGEIVEDTSEGSSCIILVQSFANFSLQYFLLL
ncbi:hypothetical protein GOBAR_DD32256 [Gossypium barbadense]|nr:hypothetical protein GOBAR_DD32256 [Gossypium barbadense]